MKTARTLFYLLLATNLILGIVSLLPFTGVQLFWKSQEGTDRISYQLSPEKIKIGFSKPAIAPASQPASAQSAPVTQQSAPVPIAQSSPQAKSEETPAHVVSTDSKPVPVTTCVELHNLTGPDSRQLSKSASKHKTLKLALTGLVPDAYWVIIPPRGGKEGAIKRVDYLDKDGFNDRYIVHDPGPYQFAISLGKFRNEDAAKRLLEDLREKEYKTARITRLDATGHSAHAKITGPQDVLTPFIEEFLKSHKEAQRDHCSE